MKLDARIRTGGAFALLVQLAVGLLSGTPVSPSTPERLTVRIPMKDGVRLSAHVYKPPGSAKSPVILIRTPYGKSADLLANYRAFVERGYTVVVQDVRGRYESEGTFRPMVQEASDGNDTLNWIARQTWSNGKIGMLGGSYVGIVQWRAALTGNPHLKAISPVVSGYDEYRDRYYSPGGALKLGHRLLWLSENLRLPSAPKSEFREFTRHLPVRTLDKLATGQRVESYQEALNHPGYDAYWKAISTREHIGNVRVPVFSVAGWYDNYVQSDLEAFALLSARSAAPRIVVGPWPHNMSIPFPDVSFGANSSAPIRRFQLEWFDYWLKTPQPAPEFRAAPVRIFVMGANRWRDEREWPLARTRFTPMYLAGRGDANTAKGDGLLAPEPHRSDLPDEFTYDPRKPVPTLGGSVCCNPKVFPWGPLDQRAAEARMDVLVFTTPPLRQDLEVTGPVRVNLFISTSAPDTDFTAKLVDVHPDGPARILTDGILRLRYRNSLERAVLAKPGEIYQVTIDAGVTSNVFKAGHRIRLDISSSNFPRFDRNPNTGRTIADETELRVATQTIYHGRNYPSHVLFPVIP
ncbi:MAG TPA: CocE/NonD family hydrolase [Bryobacteraceae bacterium]|nr:CocE/NonD family hydrolase [Bryobacteraceae bacterium]